MKKQTLNIILIAGAAAAAFFLLSKMRKKKLVTSRDYGPLEKMTEEEYESAEVIEQPKTEIKPVQPTAIIDILQKLKRTPEQKAAAQQRKLARKKKRADAKLIKGVDDISVLY